MNDPTRNIFELQIKSLKGFEFQDFIVELFLLKYGAEGFTVLRTQKDKGCDGIVNKEKRVIACYGPVKNNQKNFDKKSDDDFKDFQDNWQSRYPNWMFIINQDITPTQEQKIKSLKDDAPLLGIKQILFLIEELKNYQRRKLGNYLKIEREYLVSDYLEEILSDLLKDSSFTPDNIKYNKKELVDFEEKIKINYVKKDIEDVLNEFIYLTESGTLKKIDETLFGYEDEEINTLKYKVLGDFHKRTNGNFKERLEQLTDYYLIKYSSEEDDDYLRYIRAVLINFFEQCLIGKRTQKEKNDTSTP